MDCIRRIHCGGFVGEFPSEDTLDRIGLIRFDQRIGFLFAGCYNGRNWIATVWMVQTDQMRRGWDGGGM